VTALPETLDPAAIVKNSIIFNRHHDFTGHGESGVVGDRLEFVDRIDVESAGCVEVRRLADFGHLPR